MSDIFASATVNITPNLAGFKTKLEEDLVAIMKKVKVRPVRIAPALTVDFVGSLRKQVNAAILQAQKGIKPIRIAAIVETPKGRAINVVGRGATPAGHIAPPSATGGIAGGVTKAVAESKRLEQAQKALGLTTTRLAGIENKLLLETTELGKARERLRQVTLAGQTADKAVSASAETTDVALKAQAIALQEDIALKIDDAAASVRLAEANRALQKSTVGATVDRGALAARVKADEAAHQIVAAQERGAGAARIAAVETNKLAKARTFATEKTAAANLAERAYKTSLQGGIPLQQVGAFRVRELARAEEAAAKAASKSAAAEDKANTKRRRSSEQLTRGGQASILSLAGIRGATLAASRSFLVGAAAITVFAKAVKSFADLEENINLFQATTSATADQMERVRDAARLLGADLTLPAVSAGDAAGAMVELAKAGLTVEDSIAGARGVLELATAAAIDNAAATQLVANALNAFGLQGRDAIAIADTFANAANAAQGSIADIGTAFQQAAAAGRQVGLSFQDTSVFLTVLAKSGLRGSDAGTSLRTALIRLINPSKEAAAQFEKLGIVVHDAAGNLRPDVFVQIAEATNKLTPAQRDATIALIGGQDAFRAITILGRQTIGQFIAMRKALREEGTAAQLAEARTRGLHGAIDALGSVLETVGTDLGGKVGPGLANFTRGVAAGVTALGESNQVSETLGDTLTAVSQGFNLVGEAAKGVSVVAIPLVSTLQQIISAIGVTEILAGVAAYKLLGGAAIRLGAAFGIAQKGVFGFGVAQRASLLTTAGLKTALAGAARSLNLYLIAATAATAGIVFLLTQESAAERVTRHLTEATNALADANTAAKEASQASGTATHSVNAASLGILEAQAAANAAKTELANTSAAKGTTARRVLELQLAVALDNVAIAQQRYGDAIAESRTAAEADIAAGSRRKDALAGEKEALVDLIAQKQTEARLGQVRGRKPVEVNQLLLERTARQGVIEVLRKQVQENKKSEDAGTRDMAKRQQLLINFIKTLKTLPTDTQVNIILNSKNVNQAAKGLIENLRKTGHDGAAKYLEAFLAGTDPLASRFGVQINGTFKGVADDLRDHGFEGGKAYAAGIAAGISSRAAAIAAALSAATTAGAKASRREDFLAGAGASDSALLGAARDRLAAARTGVTAAQKAATGHPDLDSPEQVALTEAISERRAAFEHVKELRAQIASDAKQNAADAKSAADDLQQTKDESGQAVIDSILEGRKATILQNKITAAGLTAWLGDDLSANRAWIVFLKKQKEIILDTLKKIGAGKAVIAAFRKQIAALIFGIKNEITKITQDQQAALQERITQRIDLRIEIAEIKDNVPAQIKLHRQKLKRIQDELAKLRAQKKKNTIEYLELQRDEAAEQKAINDLTGQIKKTAEASAKMQFAFLQTQAGFAANLLGNLIPMGATGGLLGGTTGTGGSGTPAGGLRQVAGGFEQPRGASGSSGRGLPKPGTTGPGGPSRGGQASQTHLLREILRVLNNIYRGTGHPEAHHRRRTNASAMSLDHLGT